MSNDFHDECAARFGLVGIRMAEALQALDNLAELGRLLVASDDAELDDDARGALDAATRRAMHSTVELLAAGVASPLRDTIEVWDLVNCSGCDALFEVVELRPPTLDYASSQDGDDEWDDDDWEEDE